MEPKHRARFVAWFTGVLLQYLRKSSLGIASVLLPATWRYAKASGVVFIVKGVMVSK